MPPYVRVGFLDGVLHFGFGSLRQLIPDKTTQNCVLDAAVFLNKPRDMEEVSFFLENSGHDSKIVKETLSILLKNFLIPEGSYDQEERHSRSFLFYSLSGAEIEQVQKNVSDKTIAIVGCGGIGNVVIGSITLDKGKGAHSCKAELGYVIVRQYWGNGWTTQAIKFAIESGFEDLDIERIEAYVDPANTGSKRVLEKNGFLKEGLLKKCVIQKGIVKDRFLYSCLKAAY